MEITRVLGDFVSKQSQENLELNDLYNNLMKRHDFLKLQYIKKESEKTKEFIYKIPVENLYNFLLDFSEVLFLGIGVDGKAEGSTEIDYTIKTYFNKL
ncbi:hypothetical protein LCGC14_1991190 [marine sediment metagenome]|uniref:Uncharacterized protein n=1 Tax=marine sediment metagenome TaxID=412755 RepID=A0A0F9FU50_9ZZZZ